MVVHQDILEQDSIICGYGSAEQGEELPLVPGVLIDVVAVVAPLDNMVDRTYDQLGSGNSNKVADPNDYSVDSFIEELDEVRTRLGLVKVVVVGFS